MLQSKILIYLSRKVTNRNSSSPENCNPNLNDRMGRAHSHVRCNEYRRSVQGCSRIARKRTRQYRFSARKFLSGLCLGACLSLAWRVMVPVSGRGSSSCSVTIAEDAPLNGAAGHLRSCSDLHGSGCARIQRSCSCGTTGRRICRSRGVSTPHFSLHIPSLPLSLGLCLFPVFQLSFLPLTVFLTLESTQFFSPLSFQSAIFKAQRSMEIGQVFERD